MTSPRRVGAETSKTRDLLLDCVERLMRNKGYAGVSYRAVAAEAGVTSGLVQYYFPKLDDLFIAAIRRRSDQNLERLTALLDAHRDQPLQALWDYSRDEAMAALTTEFLALGNHRPSIRAVIAEVTEQVRQVQIQAVEGHLGSQPLSLDGLSADALLFLVTGIPKLLRLEEGVGVSTTHDVVVRELGAALQSLEPGQAGRRRSARRAR